MGQKIKNLLRAQPKYGLMGSSAKTEKFFLGSQEYFLYKRPFGIGHPPPTHQMQSICVWEGSRVPNLQTEFNYLNLFKSYCIFSDFVVPTLSPSSPRCPHVIPIVPRRSHVVSTPSMAVVSIVSTPCPVVPTLSPSSLLWPRCPHHPHVIPTSSP